MIQFFPQSDNPARDRAECFIGTTAAIILGLTAAGTTIGSLEAAHMSSGAARDSAKLQTDAANHAADVQGQAAKDALAFQERQAEIDRQTAETNRHANYDQWAVREQGLNSLGDLIGAAPRTIPAYVPLPSTATTPTSTTMTPAGAPSGALPTVSADHGDLATQISAYFKARGVSDQETPYWVGKWPELVARGQQLNDPNYAMKRLATADIFGGAGATTPTSTSTPSSGLAAPAGSIGALLPFPVAPALTINPYAAGTLGSYLPRS